MPDDKDYLIAELKRKLVEARKAVPKLPNTSPAPESCQMCARLEGDNKDLIARVIVLENAHEDLAMRLAASESEAQRLRERPAPTSKKPKRKRKKQANQPHGETDSHSDSPDSHSDSSSD